MNLKFYAQRISAAVMIAIVLLFCVILCIKNIKNRNSEKELYMLTVINGEAVLYKGTEFIAEYEGVNIDNLPAADRTALENGILFETRSQAERAVEDYDG